jgi:SnoaL-like domain
MSVVTEVADRPVTGDLYQEIQHFYARQMQLLDSGETEAWALTFTEDGVFDANGHPEPVVGRDKITAGALQARKALDRSDVRHRHWLGMLTVGARPDGSLLARCYALVVEIPLGGEAKLRFSTICEDVLVEEDGEWRVRERQVTRDDLR